jgi:acetate kinase
MAPVSVEAAMDCRFSGRAAGAAAGTMRRGKFRIRTMGLERSGEVDRRVPIAVSARHAHLSQATVHKLFGEGYELRVRNWLSQTGQFSAEETVTLVGPRGRLENVRLMGPPREQDQLELSRSDECKLGITAPLRVSGDLAQTPGLQIVGPAGSVTLHRGVITAQRHIHMNPTDAQRLGLRHGQVVSVRIDSNGRDLTFGDVVVRVAPDFRLELHLDTDEANAAGVANGDYGEIIMNDSSQVA